MHRHAVLPNLAWPYTQRPKDSDHDRPARPQTEYRRESDRPCSVPVVNLRPAFSWIKRHVISWSGAYRWLAAIIGLAVGILMGLLLFGESWRLQPDWGDLPTWLLFGIGLVGGVIGLLQFRTFVREQSAEAGRNEKRDKLMDRQLDDAERRAEADLRRQAEDVEVTWSRAREGAAGVIATGIVTNKSKRPISRISCKVMSKFDRAVLKLPNESGFTPFIQEDAFNSVIVDAKPLREFAVIGPKVSCGFAFKGLPPEPDQVFVAWFTDDAGNRWQLDEYLHLVKANVGDESEYKP
jgi:uncharacterized membrane-anchored protein YhcB (DUF1043 family)